MCITFDITPLQGLNRYVIRFPGRCPGLSSFTPLGLKKRVLSCALSNLRHDEENPRISGHAIKLQAGIASRPSGQGEAEF
jgi:hypothetical protein